MRKSPNKEITQEYVVFGESLSNEDLASLRSHFGKPLIEMLNMFFEPLVIDYKRKVGEYTIIIPISSNLDISKNAIDTRLLRHNYETKSYTEAFRASFGVFRNNDINTAHHVAPPDHPMVRTAFISFQKQLRLAKKEMEQNLEDRTFIPLDYKYQNTNDLYNLTKEQKYNREKLFIQQSQDTDKFNQIWVRGEFHLATIIARLELATAQELIMAREEILNKNEISVKIQDYGLTINEIMSGLLISNKPNERIIYKCFIEGNLNLKAILIILRNLDKIDPNDRFLAKRVIQTLVKDPDLRFHLSIESKQSILPIRKFIKKYNLPTHRNWRKGEESL